MEPEELDELLTDSTEIIESSHLFKTLDEDGRRELIRTGYVISYDPGQTLMKQGDIGSTMYLLMRGRVSVETDKGAGSSIHLAELGRGACIGEVGVLTGSPRTATVKAIDDVKVIAFEKHRVQRVIDAHPKVRKLLEAMIEGRARDTVEKLISG
ncbi:MAG: cyclic nucleotide-binding domain-containing protein [Sandaracinaceae bacterium]|nr:cyclic nucleotide-binding domain-containing protein [Sandaracinaceae bacterium]